MAKEALNGKDYWMFIDTVTEITASKGANYKAVMCEVSSSFSGTTDEQTVSNKCSGGWANSNPNTKSWTFSGEANAVDESGSPSLLSLNAIAELWKSGQKFWAKQAASDPSMLTDVFTEGVVWVSSFEQTFGNEDAVTFSYTFTGVGEPNFTEA